MGGARSSRQTLGSLFDVAADGSLSNGAPGMTLNAPLFEGVSGNKAMVRGGWGAAPVAGLEPQAGDLVVEKMRMSAWEGTKLETLLKSGKRDMIINTGAWTNMSVEHTARTVG